MLVWTKIKCWWTGFCFLHKPSTLFSAWYLALLIIQAIKEPLWHFCYQPSKSSSPISKLHHHRTWPRETYIIQVSQNDIFKCDWHVYMCVHLRFAQCTHAACTNCGYYLGWCSFFSVHPIVRLLFERSVYSGSYYYPDTGTLTFWAILKCFSKL